MIIYEKNDILPSQGIGLGYLNDIVSAVVTEEINGAYYLEFTTLPDDRVLIGNVVQALTHDGKQYFRINEITQNSDNTVEVIANHISYDLNKIVVLPQFVEGSFTEIFAEYLNNSVNGKNSNFTIYTMDNSQYNSIDIKKPINAKSLLMGEEGSMLDVFGGEYKFNNFAIGYYKNRGIDRDVCFYYGSGISSISAETTNEDEYTGIVPYAIITEQLYMLSEKYVGTIESLKVVDFSDKFSDNNPYTSDKLKQYAEEELTRCIIKNNINITFNELQNIGLNIIELCDIITIKYNKPDIELKAKVVKINYDVLRKKIINLEVGYLKNIKISRLLKGGEHIGRS